MSPEESLKLGFLVDRLKGQTRYTRGYLIDNGIDPHFADILMSHYTDMAREIEALLPARTVVTDTAAAKGPVNCQSVLRAQGKPYPRTCERCGLGPCPNDGNRKP